VAYDNNSDKVVYIKKTGTEVINAGYEIDVSTLIDSTTQLSSTLTDPDELVVVRKFDHSTIDETPGTYDHSASPITSDEAWSAWTLPSVNDSGSTMYTLTGTILSLSTTAADYTWTTVQSGRASDIILPSVVAADTIYVLRKTYALTKLVSWTAGSKITSTNLNLSDDQLLFLSQELMSLWHNIHSLNPAVGQPDGICPLDSSGVIAAGYVNIDNLSLGSENGVQGDGSADSKFSILLQANSGLAVEATGIKADTVDNVTTTDSYRPLSATQGKSLQQQITSLGTGVVFKGAGDMVGSAGETFYNSIYTDVGATPSAGDTVTHSGSGTAAHSTWGGITVAQYNLVRYSGSAWQVVSSSAPLEQDGSTPLLSNWGAGAYQITTASAATPSAGDDSYILATTKFVQQELSGTKLSELGDVNVNVDDDTSAPAGQMIYWDGDSWEKVERNITDALSTDKILSTGDSVQDLDDVATTSPTEGQYLSFTASTSKWTPASLPSALDPLVALCGGDDPNGDADNSADIQTALNQAALGYYRTAAGVTKATTATLSILDFRSRTHQIGDGTDNGTQITLPGKRDITVRNGTLEFNDNTSSNYRVIRMDAAGTTQSTTLSTIAIKGDTRIHVADETNFVAGDMIEIEAPVTGDNAIDHQVWDRSGVDDEVYAIQLVVISRVDAANNMIYLEEPLNHTYASGTSAATTVKKYTHTDTTDTGQAVNWLWDNMTFNHELSSEMVCEENAIYMTGNGSESTDNTVKVTVPTGHGVGVGATMLLIDHDIPAADLEDPDDFLDVDHTVTVATSTELSCEMDTGSEWLGSDGNSGGAYGRVVAFNDNLFRLEHARDFTFRNCTFNGFRGNVFELYRCKNIRFENCTFNKCRWGSGKNHGAGIRVEECDGVHVKDCSFNDCSWGVVCPTSTYTSREIHIDNSKFHCLSAVYLRSGITGNNSITSCDIKTLPWNEERSNFGYQGNDSLRYDVEFYGNNIEIRDNKIGNVRTQPPDTIEHTAFWGQGRGYTVGGGGTYGEAPANWGSIRTVTCQDSEDINHDADTSVGQWGWSKGIQIIGNTMISYWIGVTVEFTRNTRWGTGNSSNFTMRDNHISTMRLLNMSMSSADAANINAYNIRLNNNTSYVTPPMKKISNLSYQGINLLTASYARGMFIYPYAGRIYGLQIHGNHMQAGVDIGYAYLLGTSGHNTGKLNRMSFQHNYTINFKWGISFYAAANNSARSQMSSSRVWNNVFYSLGSGGAWVYNYSKFHGHNNNYAFNIAAF